MVSDDTVRLLFQRDGWVPAEIKPLRLVPGQTVTIDVRMDRGAKMQGAIRPEPGQILPPNLRVRAVQQGGRVQWAQVAEEGTFVVTGLEVGSCRIEVQTESNHRVMTSQPAIDAVERTIREPRQVLTLEPLQLVEVRTLSGPGGAIKSVSFSPDGKTLLSAVLGSKIRLWDPQTGALKRTLGEQESGIRCAVFSPDGQVIASGRVQGAGECDGGHRGSGEVQLWDGPTGMLKQTLGPHGKWVRCLAFSPDGKTLASGAEGDPTVKLWDVRTGKVKRTLEHRFRVTSVAFSPDGRTLVSVGGDQTGRLWDPQTGKLKRTLKGHLDHVPKIAFSPDGQTLAIGGLVFTEKPRTYSGEVRLWDVRTGRLKRTLTVRDGGVNSIAFSPDGQTLACGNYWARKPATVGIWDWRTGELEKMRLGSASGRPTVTFSPDGKTLASGDGLGVTLWQVGRADTTDERERLGGSADNTTEGEVSASQ